MKDFEDTELRGDMVDARRNAWNMACLSAGIPALSTDTAARLMAVMYVHGNNEYMVFNPSFLADVRYIQLRFDVHGGGTPDADFAELLKTYVKELEDYEIEHAGETTGGSALFGKHIPQWAHDLFMRRYKIKLIN